ncbi:MFS transporter [Pseudonocardia sp. GCM10023141]|uniref:MFS transporter n=1 Tax=Pseudonocardia sp. GCM10023141 TaxID=3252653 RepID=UPI00361213F5
MASAIDSPVRTAFAPLRSRAFRRYAVGQLPSITCSWAQVVALSAVVVALDPVALAWVVALQFVPTLVLGPWCGALADRFDRRTLLMAAEAGLGLVAAGYAVAAATDRLTLPVIGVLAAAWGIVNAVDTPARRALTPQLVPPVAAPAAAALSGTLMLLGMTLGAALGGLLVPAFGAAIAFGVNALSFLLDVVVLATLRIGKSPRTPRAPRQVRDGLAHVWRTPALRVPVIVLAAVATTTFSYQVSVPTIVQEQLGGGPGAIGAALTAFTAGSLAGTILAAARGRPSRRTTVVATAVVAAGQLLVGVRPDLAFAGLAVAGLGWSVLLITVVAQLQQARPDMLGRVMSVFAVVLLGATVVSGPLAGWLAAVAGATAPFLLGAAAAALTAGSLAGRR